MDRQRIGRTARRVGRATGYELIRRNFYSPVPDLEALPAEVWTRKSKLSGVAFPADAGLGFVRAEFGALLAEYQPPVAATDDPRDFHLNNGLYESLDAHTLYAAVRRFAPRRVLELGSGLSSLVIADALRDGGLIHTDHVIYDPFAREHLMPTLRRIADLRTVSAVDTPDAEVTRLQPGDLFFVDTTHTVKLAGDVNRIVLELLPLVPPGVIVHIHDIYLPHEYPRVFFAERRFFWAEQYLVQAFLAFNGSFEVLFANAALWRQYPDEVRDLIGGAFAPRTPSGFWLRRTLH